MSAVGVSFLDQSDLSDKIKISSYKAFSSRILSFVKLPFGITKI